MTPLKHNNKDTGLLSYPIPENAIEPKIIDGLGLTWLDGSDPSTMKKEPLPEGKWELLGIISKDECSFDVEPYVASKNIKGSRFFADYLMEEDEWFNEPCESAETSFYSLLSANKCWLENPLQRQLDVYVNENMDIDETYCTIEKEWQQAQKRTSPKYIILQNPNNQ